MSRPAARFRYAPALDGLRALSCLAVMLYHAGYLPGGFLGVDVFFTLSGFLITSLLVEELRAAGRIDLAAFWRRRVYRIVPLFATVTLTWFAWGWGAHSRAGDETMVGALSGLLFVTNWLLSTHPVTVGALGAGWSVAAEEQFYLLWPLVAAGLFRLCRTERRMAAVAGLGAFGLAAHRYVMAPHVPWARVWHGVETQADAILIGCAVALGWRCTSRAVSRLAGPLLVAAVLLAHDSRPLTAQLLMPAVALSTALLIPALQEHGGWLAWGPIRAIGKRSYGLYLWSYPITYVATKVHGLHGPVVPALVFPLTFAVTEVTYRLIEVPFRRLGRRPPAVRRSAASGSAPGGPLRLSPGRP